MIANKVHRINELHRISLDYETLIPVVIERLAFKPISPVSPDKIKYLLLAAFFGLLLGGGIAMLLIAIENRKKHEHLFSQHLVEKKYQT